MQTRPAQAFGDINLNRVLSEVTLYRIQPMRNADVCDKVRQSSCARGLYNCPKFDFTCSMQLIRRLQALKSCCTMQAIRCFDQCGLYKDP